MKKEDFYVKNVKTFTGREGIGFSAVLYRKGEKLCTVNDFANGGCYSYSLAPSKVEALQKEAQEILNTDYYEAHDELVLALVNDYEMKKKAKRLCKTKTVVVFKGDPEGTFRTINIPYSPANKQALLNKFPEIVSIKNEEFS